MSFPSPERPNLFADVPANPYAAPSYQASAGPAVPFTREEARLRLLSPAIGLILFSLLWLGYMSMVVFTVLVDASRWPGGEDAAAMAGLYVWLFLCLALFTIPAIVTIAGAVQMLRVKSYRFCWTAAILGVVPCTMFCFIFTLPFGIWGMIVLYDPRIKAAFMGGASPFSAKY